MEKFKLKVFLVFLCIVLHNSIEVSSTSSSTINKVIKSDNVINNGKNNTSSEDSSSVPLRQLLQGGSNNNGGKRVHGPNPGPIPIRTPKNTDFRSRFPIFPKNKTRNDTPGEKFPRVNIIEARDAAGGPSIKDLLESRRNNSTTTTTIGDLMGEKFPTPTVRDLVGDKNPTIGELLQSSSQEDGESDEYLPLEDDEEQEQEEGHDPSAFSRRSGVVYGGYSPHLKPPPPPPSPAPSSYNYNKPRPPPPTILGYKPRPPPGIISGTSTTMSSIIFPPIVPEEITPAPTPPSPVGPPSPTFIPIIGGGSGGGGSTTEEDIFPPSPPDPDIFPPSPPEIDNGVAFPARALPLKSSRSRVRLLSEGQSSSKEASSTKSHGRVRMKLRDLVRDSLESSSKEDSPGGMKVGEIDQDNVITDFVFSDIRCLKTRSREYFGATIHMKSGYHAPYVRDRPQDSLKSNECRLSPAPGSQNQNTLQMRVSDLRGCGVETCGDHLCLTMVFPRVPSLALADDEVTTIKCLPQKASMADTRTISFAGDALDNRRSSSTVEGGGQDFAAEVGVFRQAPSSSSSSSSSGVGASGGNLFVKRVNSGGVVQLGEPLQLRSIIRAGDGWKHSRLSDVKVWRMRDSVPAGRNLESLDPKDASEVITLVDANGCRNDEYQVIAEKHPLKDPRNDLIHHFTFKAFLFRGQRSHEPLVLTAKVHACQEDVDCLPKNCHSASNSRGRRSPVEIRNASAIVHDWDSHLALRVVGLKDHGVGLDDGDFQEDPAAGRSFPSGMSCAEKIATSALGGGLIVLLLCSVGIALYAYILKGRSSSLPTNHLKMVENGGNQPPYGVHFRMNKPLPPLPPPDHHQHPQDKKQETQLSKTDVENVAKFLKQLKNDDNKDLKREKGSKHHQGEQQNQNDYGCIDEEEKSSKVNDGVYIVYFDKDRKGLNEGKSFRPKSAPPSLRGKKGRGSSLKQKKRKKLYHHGSTEEELSPTEDSSEDPGSTTTTDDSSDGQRSPKALKCVGFGDHGRDQRQTVRNLKSRSNHHKVVSGIRRRLSSFYNGNNGPNNNGHSKYKPSSTAEIIPRGQLSSSDLDSAYYGSELGKDDSLLHEIRQVADKRQSQRGGGGRVVIGGAISPPLLPGETKSAHFVTRNDNSTKILIVPETHV